MKLNRAKSVCDQRWKACLGVLLASALAFAATHRCGHLLHYVFTSIVLLGGIARYWRPGHLGVGDHRPLVILLRKQVKFNPEVECMAVPRLVDIADDKKAQLWWQQDDFDEFLKVRIEIAKAYKAAAQTLGVEFNAVCSVGAHSFAGYQAMSEAYPSLKDESRRGLGLGRKRSRAKNRVAYISAVTREQKRQHDLGIVDEEALSRVAGRHSKNDQEYAHFLAQTYYEQDRADEAAEKEKEAEEASGESICLPDMEASGRKESQSARHSRIGSNESTRKADDDSPSRFWTFSRFKELLVDSTDEVPPSPSPRNSVSRAKGFGLSKFQLQAAGLSATGHALLKRPNTADDNHDSHDSEMSGAESEGPTDMD